MQLTNPILSLQIVFVLGMLVIALIAVFQDEYDGDLGLFLLNLVTKSNVIMILVLFVVMVSVTLLVHLYNLLKPYNEQQAHEAWVDRVSLILKFEASNKWKAADVDTNAKYEKTMELLGSLKEEMVRVKAAPKLLSMFELNETRIQSIIAAIVVPFTAFAGTFIQGIFNEIGESSGIIPTASPTNAPTNAPNVF